MAMMGYGSGWGWMWLFGFLTVAGIVLLILVVVRIAGGGIARGPTGADRDGGSAGSSRAREILDVRYASGEISTEEYRERLQALREP